MTKYILLSIILTLIYCRKSDYYPRPLAYPRIDMIESNYPKKIDTICDMYIEIPKEYLIQKSENCNFDILIPRHKAVIYNTFLKIDNNDPNNNLFLHSEYANKLVYEHQIKANSIEKIEINNKQKNIYGIYYILKGNVASNIQYFITDSTQHIIRGVMYFNEKPNYDSLNPVIENMHIQINKIINSIKW